MGLFSKKPKEIVIDLNASEENKRKMREMFSSVIEDADTYHIIHASNSDQTFDRGFFIDTRITTFHNFIMGYRESDFQVVLLEIDLEIKKHAEPFYVSINEIKETNYYPKLCQAWLIYKDGPVYGIKMEIDDVSSTSKYGMHNISQSEEREDFLNFLEKYTDELQRRGFKFKRFKR